MKVRIGFVPYLKSQRIPEIFIAWGRSSNPRRVYRKMFSLRWSFGRLVLVHY